VVTSKLNVEGLASKVDLHGKQVLIRLDLNVPLSKEGKITNEKRLTAVVPTLKFLKEQGAKCVIATHIGRPKEPPFSDNMKTKVVAPRLSELIDVDVQYVDEIIGSKVSKASSELTPGGVLLLENVRFDKGETKNNDEFSKALVESSNAKYYVNDAFGTAHRAHSSTVGVCKHMELSAAGFLMDKELRYLKGAVDQPIRPLAAIIGGAKVSTKVPVIESLLNKCDNVFLGGGMIFTFYRAMGLDVGGSLVEADLIPLAKQLMENAKKKGVNLYLPTDVVVAQDLTGEGPSQVVDVNAIPDGWKGLDVGPATTTHFSDKLRECKTVVWNGPMGVFEVPQYAHGTLSIAQILAEITKQGAVTIIGGGDSVAAVEQAGLGSQMSHISTGGGASLELLEGKELPGVAALTDIS
jgi:phosphoglycerate kinase